ncbi:MAG: Yip1 family protein [Paracoccus sp. (in: a-proteobacteria)]|uniref:Yip1 family protein n=1 Tax=Paracoccus sp. TaxID=267 RepID=UPI0026DEA87F|nr:Yip1 family protein [Paracoccus sp. (in: a-proteobacteria)]MDO5631940.1 Yip1 family protein [Paracoccus sp. (in: a-proteobacteria)]
MRFDDLQALALLTFRNPARAVQALRSLNLPMPARWMALALVVSLSALLTWGASMLFPVSVDTGMNDAVAQPLMVAGVQFAVLSLAAFLMAAVGRSFGGTGTFPDALLLMTWIEFILLVVQTAQVVLMLLFPIIASLMWLVAAGIFVWLMVQFTKALHGFDSAAKVALGMIMTFLAAGMVMAVVLSSLGLLPVPA